MKEIFAKIKERLEENSYDEPIDDMNPFQPCRVVELKDAIEIVKKVAEEYVPDINVGSNDGWIPCSERLPEENKTVRVWLSFTNPIISFTKRAWWVSNHFEWDNGRIPKTEPIAWMKAVPPEPYKPKGD